MYAGMKIFNSETLMKFVEICTEITMSLPEKFDKQTQLQLN